MQKEQYKVATLTGINEKKYFTNIKESWVEIEKVEILKKLNKFWSTKNELMTLGMAVIIVAYRKVYSEILQMLQIAKTVKKMKGNCWNLR